MSSETLSTFVFEMSFVRQGRRAKACLPPVGAMPFVTMGLFTGSRRG